MPDAKQIQFGHRLRRIDKRNRQYAGGVISSVNHDGLIIARPRRRTSRLPLRGIFLALAIVMAFKGVVLAQIGQGAYDHRVALLAEGSIVEQIGAYAMQADPVTQWIAEALKLIM